MRAGVKIRMRRRAGVKKEGGEGEQEFEKKGGGGEQE